MSAKETHAIRMSERFNDIMESFKSDLLSPSETVIIGLQNLKYYLESSHGMFDSPHFEMVQLIKAMEETRLGSERRILDKRFLEGCIIEGLIRFGAKKLHAYEFMFEYLGIAESAAKASHKIFNSSYYSPRNLQDESTDEFVAECCDWIIEFINATNRKLPAASEFSTADKAFQDFYKSCKRSSEAFKAHAYQARALRPYEMYNEEAQSFEFTSSQQEAD